MKTGTVRHEADSATPQGRLERQIFYIHAGLRRELPTSTASESALKSTHGGTLGAPSCRLLLAIGQVNSTTIKAKSNSKVIHDATQRLTNTKQEAAKGKNTLTFSFTLFIEAKCRERERERNRKG